MMTLDRDITWMRELANGLAPGGMWGVPRSGLIFTRTDTGLMLTAQMPWTDELPITREELIEQQDADYDAIRVRGELAGIPVTRAAWPAGGDEL